MSLTFTDLFCGAGGSSIGLAEAGFELRLAANHWERAIETHAENFRDADHLCADVSNYDMRRLPRTDILWASPECTWHSPAGGRRRRGGQTEMFDEYVPSDAEVRSRATAYDVIRATEVHRYAAVIVENVVEFAHWELFDWWLDAFKRLRPSYNPQIVCVSSAHVWSPDNPPAPQWRDRLYVVLTREDVPLPEVEPRPIAWCAECNEQVRARQSWKRPDRRRIGKYGTQYVYRCPNTVCHEAVVEPFVLPAAAAIDWSDLGTRIGDRKRPLAEATMRRILAGLEMFAQPCTVAAAGNTYEAPGGSYVRAWPAFDSPLRARTCTTEDGLAVPPVVLNVNHDDDGRPYPAHSAPLSPRTTKIGDGIACPPFMVSGNSGGIESRIDPATGAPLRTLVANGRGSHQLVLPEPFITMLRTHATGRGVSDDALATIATGNHHYLTIPPGAFYVKNFTPRGNWGQMAKDAATEPLGAITARDHHSLVIPYRRGRAKTTAEPFHAFGTKDSAALVAPAAIDIEDCHFRMLKPREHLRGQRFPDSYVVKGNLGEQTMQAGNAVSSNVAHFLAAALAEVLG